jgi:hypothetical protein
VNPTFITNNVCFRPPSLEFSHSTYNPILRQSVTHSRHNLTSLFNHLASRTTNSPVTPLLSFPLLASLLIPHPPLQRSQTQRRQRHIAINTNVHRLGVMAVLDPVRVGAIPGCNVVEHRGYDGEFGVRFCGCLRCRGCGFAGQGGGEWDDVAEDEQHQGEGDELPAVGPDGVEFEVCGNLCQRTKSLVEVG